MRRIKQLLLYFGLLLVGFSFPAFAAPGDLDPGFGTGGVAIENYDSIGNVTGNDHVIQTSGKIVVAGNYFINVPDTKIALARFSTTGVLDTTFGTNGWTIENFGYPYISATRAASQADGKIVVTGPFNDGTGDHMYVARFSADGQVDTGFGNGGISIINLGMFIESIDVAVQADGKILIVGSIYDGTQLDILLARVDKKGKLDQSFGNHGSVIQDFNGMGDTGSAVAVAPNKRILVASTTGIAPGNSAFGLSRYTSKGQLDTSFSNDGKVTTDFGPNHDPAVAIEIQTDGKIVVGGFAQPGSAVFAFVRYNSDGSVDLSHTEDYAGSLFEAAGGLAVGANGRILLAGRVLPDGSETSANSAVACFNGTTGAIDTTFGISGWAINDFGTDSDLISSIGLQSDNKIVSVGSSKQGDGRYYFVIARYTGCG